jgi:hypothetical protein
MIEWLKIRGQAISDAKKNTAHKNVNVYLYLELNHVNITRNNPVKRVLNHVLPKAPVDFVSISSYDFQGFSRLSDALMEGNAKAMVKDALDYVESFLPPAEISGKRVFIGEIGYTKHHCQGKFKGEDGELIQCVFALQNAIANFEWGVPYWLWWAVFDNEKIGKTSKYKGFGVYDQINDRPRMLLSQFETYYQWARKWIKLQGHVENKTQKDDFRKAALIQLQQQLTMLLAHESLSAETKNKISGP